MGLGKSDVPWVSFLTILFPSSMASCASSLLYSGFCVPATEELMALISLSSSPRPSISPSLYLLGEGVELGVEVVGLVDFSISSAKKAKQPVYSSSLLSNSSLLLAFSIL